MSTTTAPAPVGGRIWTPAFRVLSLFAASAAVLLVVRFVAGIGSTTALNDGYPWGLWIAFDVVVGTAIACGGYAVALLVYLLNRGRYHTLVRAAVLTSALGYTLAGLSVVIDLGRWWNMWALPVRFWQWNFNSILLEVALCIMLYTLVAWIELAPAFLERARTARSTRLAAFAAKAVTPLNRAMPFLLALGLLLPTMHQSSLGSLMMLAGPRLHALWLSPLLPLLFLVSCLAMGYGAVILESTLSTRAFGRQSETRTLAALARPVVVLLLGFALLRLADIVASGEAALLVRADRFALLFWLELLLVIAPAAMLMTKRHTQAAGLFRAALLIVAGGALYRFSTFLFAFDPGAWRYFPAVPELLITVGLVAAEIMAYVALVKTFPILHGAPAPAVRVRPVPAGVVLPAAEPAAGD